MFEKRFKLEIVTPQRVMYESDVNVVRAPGVEAPFAVLVGHTPFLSLLEVGEVSFQETDANQYMAISGGILEVLRTGVTILAENAEWAHEIDVNRARSARERAEQRLSSSTPDTDIQRAEAALMRALNRLKVAQRAGGI